MQQAFKYAASIVKPAAHFLGLGLREPEQQLSEFPQEFSSVMPPHGTPVGNSGNGGPVQQPASLEARKEDGSMP